MIAPVTDARPLGIDDTIRTGVERWDARHAETDDEPAVRHDAVMRWAPLEPMTGLPLPRRAVRRASRENGR